jgi:hypothetical protein
MQCIYVVFTPRQKGCQEILRNVPCLTSFPKGQIIMDYPYLTRKSTTYIRKKSHFRGGGSEPKNYALNGLARVRDSDASIHNQPLANATRFHRKIISEKKGVEGGRQKQAF